MVGTQADEPLQRNRVIVGQQAGKPALPVAQAFQPVSTQQVFSLRYR